MVLPIMNYLLLLIPNTALHNDWFKSLDLNMSNIFMEKQTMMVVVAAPTTSTVWKSRNKRWLS